MLGQRIPVRVDTGAEDVISIARGPQSCVVAQEVIAGNDGIASPDDGGKSPRPYRAVASLRRIGIAQENGVVEIKEEHVGRAPQQGQLPGGQELTLQNDQVSPAELVAQPQTRQPRSRPGTQGQMVAFLFPNSTIGRQPIPATNVVGVLDES